MRGPFACRRRVLCVAQLLLVAALPGPIAAGEVAAEGVRYVVADGGLRLRARPGLEAEILALIPFGAEVRLVGEVVTGQVLFVDHIPGRWVHLSYQGKRGHAFSGYLIHYPPPTHQGLESYARQLERAGLGVEQTTTDHDGSNEYHPGTEVELVLEQADMAEAFLIARKLFDIPASLSYPGPGKEGEKNYSDPYKPETLWVRDLVAIRDEDGELLELRYYVRAEGWGTSHFIRRRPVGTALLVYEFAD